MKHQLNCVSVTTLQTQSILLVKSSPCCIINIHGGGKHSRLESDAVEVGSKLTSLRLIHTSTSTIQIQLSSQLA